MFELPPKGGLLFSEVVGWSATSSPGGILLLTISLLLYSSLTLCYSPSPSFLVCVWKTHMCGCAHIYKPSNTRPAPPSRFSHIWPLVSWCLWAIVCSADDHCHRLIPLHVALWWMGPTLASTDTGVLDHRGRRNEESRHRRGDLILYFIFYSLGSVSHDPILWVISRWEKTIL